MPCTHNPQTWKTLLRERLKGRSLPVFAFDERVIPAASVWTGSRQWVEYLRARDTRPGDRIVLALPPSPGWLMVFVAALCEGCTVIPVTPDNASDPDTIIDTFDPTLVIVRDDARANHPAIVRVDRHGLPASDASRRPMKLTPAEDIRLILATSGTSGRAKFVGLTDTNIMSVIDSHRNAFGLEEGEVCLSLLPWNHAFGLIIDLLPAIVSGCCIIRDDEAGRCPEKVIRLASEHHISWCSMVPLQVERLIDHHAGASFLQNLRGGVVGGAAASPRICSALERTGLRVGYGQTEASPGITLGEPGAWPWRGIGRPLGCDARLGPDAHLLCRGPNVFTASWSASTGFDRLDPHRWIDTGDLIEQAPDGSLRFVGRSDRAIKLANGRLVDAPRLEVAIVQAIRGAAYATIQSTDRARLTVDVFVDGEEGPLTHELIARCETEAARALGNAARIVGRIRIQPLSQASRDAKGAPRRLDAQNNPKQEAPTTAIAA